MGNSRRAALVLGGTGRTGHLPVVQAMTTVTTAGGAAAFAAAGIAAVAAGTPAGRGAHAGAVFAPTGPGRSRPRSPASSRASPANKLTAAVASGHRSRPDDDVRNGTGSPPASVADFAHRNARAWAVPAAHL